jgi:multiple sugar transport system substrate-binding protein
MNSQNVSRPLSRRQLIQNALAGAAGTAALAAGARHASAGPDQSTSLLPSASLQGDRVSILHWSHPLTDDDMTVFGPLIERFQEAGNNIDVQVELIPWDSRIEQKMSAAVAGTSPDTSYLNVDEFTTYVEEGALVALDEYTDEEFVSDFLPGPRDAMEWDGGIYEIPVLHAFRVAYYNKDIWEQSGLDPEVTPVTWDEMESAFQAILDAKNAGEHDAWPVTLAGSGSSSSALREFNPWFYQTGGSLVTPDGQSGYGTDAGIEAMEFGTRLFQTYASEADRASTGDDVRERFGQGQVAYLHNDELRGIQFWQESFPDLNFGLAEIQENTQRWTHGGVGCFGMWTPSEERDATWAWISFLTGDGNLEYNQGFGYVPPRQSIRDEFEPSAGPLLQEALGFQQYAGVEKHPRLWDMWDVITPEMQAAFAGLKSPEEAINDAAERINSNILD